MAHWGLCIKGRVIWPRGWCRQSPDEPGCDAHWRRWWLWPRRLVM